MGALLVTAPEGAVLLLAGVAIGRLLRQTALGAVAADAALFPILTRRRGHIGAATAGAVLLPMLAKCLLGNRRAATLSTYGWRLLFDRDQRRPSHSGPPMHAP